MSSNPMHASPLEQIVDKYLPWLKPVPVEAPQRHRLVPRPQINQHSVTLRPEQAAASNIVSNTNGASKDMVLVPREEYEALLELRQATAGIEPDGLLEFPPVSTFQFTLNIEGFEPGLPERLGDTDDETDY